MSRRLQRWTSIASNAASETRKWVSNCKTQTGFATRKAKHIVINTIKYGHRDARCKQGNEAKESRSQVHYAWNFVTDEQLSRWADDIERSRLSEKLFQPSLPAKRPRENDSDSEPDTPVRAAKKKKKKKKKKKDKKDKKKKKNKSPKHLDFKQKKKKKKVSKPKRRKWMKKNEKWVRTPQKNCGNKKKVVPFVLMKTRLRSVWGWFVKKCEKINFKLTVKVMEKKCILNFSYTYIPHNYST